MCNNLGMMWQHKRYFSHAFYKEGVRIALANDRYQGSMQGLVSVHLNIAEPCTRGFVVVYRGTSYFMLFTNSFPTRLYVVYKVSIFGP